MGEKPQTDCEFALGQAWTLPDASATDLEFEGNRVKSPVIGRDMNPMGRGDGTYYCNGGNAACGASLAIRGTKPDFVGERAYGYGSSINNYQTGDSEWWERIFRAWNDDECPLTVITCPVDKDLASRDDPCEGMDTSDPRIFCCSCMTAMCPEYDPDDQYKGCKPDTGCVHKKEAGFQTYCYGPLKPPKSCEQECKEYRSLFPCWLLWPNWWEICLWLCIDDCENGYNTAEQRKRNARNCCWRFIVLPPA